MTQPDQTNDSGAQQSLVVLHLAARQRKQKGGAVLPVLVALVVGYLLFRFLGWQLVLAAVAGIVLLLALLIEEKLMAAVAAVVAAAALLAHCHKDEAPEAPPVVQQPQVPVPVQQEAPAPAQPRASVPAQLEASAPAQQQVPEQTEQKPASQPDPAENVDVMVDGLTALMRAANAGSFDRVKDLVERGANVNIPSSNNAPMYGGTDGRTALSFAAWGGHLDIVKFLVEHGANVAAKDNYRYTPIVWAAQRGHAPVVKYFLENVEEAKSQESLVRALVAAIEEFHSCIRYCKEKVEIPPSLTESIHLLIDAGADVMEYVSGEYGSYSWWRKYTRVSPWNRVCTNWMAGGLYSTQSNLAKLMKHMVAHGADVNAELDWIDHRYTGRIHPIMFAVVRRDVDLVKFLVDAGAKVNVRATGEVLPSRPWESTKFNYPILGFTPLGWVYREMDKLQSDKCGGYKERLCCIDGKCEDKGRQQALDAWKAIETMLKAAGAHE